MIAQSIICNAQSTEKQKIGLSDIHNLIEQNSELIIEKINQEIAQSNFKQAKAEKLPDLDFGGYYSLSNKNPLDISNLTGTTSQNYNLSLLGEIDVYNGGIKKLNIKQTKLQKDLSKAQLREIKQNLTIQAYDVIYSIYRNIKYKEVLNASINLRQKEYDRIEQLYKNGIVLKSDLLRSKLYIKDLQRDEINIQNSIIILSDRLCLLLGLEEKMEIVPDLESHLDYSQTATFDQTYTEALTLSPLVEIERIKLNDNKYSADIAKAKRLPNIQIYAGYGLGSPQNRSLYNHELNGEVGVKASVPISTYYKHSNYIKSVKHRVAQQEIQISYTEEILWNLLHNDFTRYNESLINIEIAKEKIEMAKESVRILRNSYFNQQALLIDFLEAENSYMTAHFEWIEAIVASQKHYWAIQKNSGKL